MALPLFGLIFLLLLQGSGQVDGALTFFCSQQLNSSTEPTVVYRNFDVADNEDAYLLSHEFYGPLPESLASVSLLPVGCKLRLLIDPPPIVEADERQTTIKPDDVTIQLTFEEFDILETDINLEAKNEYAAGSICSVNFVKIYLIGNNSSSLELGADFCGKGTPQPFQAPPGRSVQLDVLLTQPFRGFKIRFEFQVEHQLPNRQDDIIINPCPRTGYVPCNDPGILRCIPAIFQCDGRNDCDSGSDEADCLQSKPFLKDDSGCGSPRDMTGQRGVIRSTPGYPRQNYTNNARCRWYITLPLGQTFNVVFNERFGLVNYGRVTAVSDCSFDHLTFYGLDRATGQLKLIGRVCGAFAPKPPMLPYDTLLVTFETDDTDTGPGFEFQWAAVVPENYAVFRDRSLAMPDAACTTPNGTVLDSLSGSLSTPLMIPANSVECSWWIAPKLQSGVVQHKFFVRFYEFTVDRSQNCNESVVEMFFVDAAGRNRRARLSCGKTKPSLDQPIVAKTPNPFQIIYRPGSPAKSHRFQLSYLVITSTTSASTPRPADGSSVVQQGQCGIAPVKLEPPVTSAPYQATPAKPGSWPWVAALIYTNPSLNLVDQHICAATIIDKNWLVGAASCFSINEQFRLTSRWQVVVGRHAIEQNVAWDENSPVILGQIKKIFTHRKFGKTLGSKEHDIALIQLTAPLPVGPDQVANAACLPSRDLHLNDTCYALGWLPRTQNGTNSSQFSPLLQAKMPVVELENCKSAEFFYLATVKDSMLCAGLEAGGIDACQGDMGGPLVCLVDDRWELFGIASFSKGCAGRTAPGVFTRLSSFKPWILKAEEAMSPIRPKAHRQYPIADVDWRMLDTLITDDN